MAKEENIDLKMIRLAEQGVKMPGASIGRKKSKRSAKKKRK